MKVTVKTTQQKVFQVEVEPTETVADLKAKIQESQGHLAAGQKIIYSGQILTDDKTVESCGIKEKDFLVLMVSKPKPVPAAPVAPVITPAALAPVETPATDSTSAPAVPEPAAGSAATSSEPQTMTATPSTASAFGDPSSFLAGDSLQSAINEMVGMGFPRDQVMKAMRASFNNADRAVEYLMTASPSTSLSTIPHLTEIQGIPAHLEEPVPAAAPVPANPTPAAAQPSAQPASNEPQNLFQLAQQQQQGGGRGSVPTTGASAAAPQLNLDALRDNPQIQQLREQLEQNPGLIQPLIQQLAGQNPALAQALAQNPEQLLQLLGLDDDGGMPPPGSHVINVTEEERDAIQRLQDLGFPRQLVLEAYFACDKNEELAANYLFESNLGDES